MLTGFSLGQQAAPASSSSQSRNEVSSTKSYPSTILVDNNEDFACVVCNDIADQPYITTKCRCTKVYCKTCITKWLSTNSICMYCRHPTSISDCVANDWLQRKINQADVRCINHEEGCRFTGTYNRFKDHIGECGFEKAECAHKWKGCQQMIERRMKEDHENTCVYGIAKCDFCDTQLTLTQLRQHQSNVYGCMQLTECANKCTIQQCINANVIHTYRARVAAMLHTLPSSMHAPIDAGEYTTAQGRHNSHCPNLLIHCTICDEQLPRHEMNNHLNSAKNVAKHLTKLQHVILEKDVAMQEKNSVIRVLQEKLAACENRYSQLTADVQSSDSQRQRKVALDVFKSTPSTAPNVASFTASPVTFGVSNGTPVVAPAFSFASSQQAPHSQAFGGFAIDRSTCAAPSRPQPFSFGVPSTHATTSSCTFASASPSQAQPSFSFGPAPTFSVQSTPQAGGFSFTLRGGFSMGIAQDRKIFRARRKFR